MLGSGLSSSGSRTRQVHYGAFLGKRASLHLGILTPQQNAICKGGGLAMD